MRLRLGRSVIAIGVLAAVLSVGGIGPSQAGAPYQPQQGAGLNELLASLVDGTNPLITPVESTEVTSPLGGSVTDATGTATLTNSFHVTANIGEFQDFADLDFDGTTDIPTELGRFGLGDDTIDITPLNSVLAPTLETTAPVFGSSMGTLWDQLGLDPTDDGVQDFNGTPIRIAGDMNWEVPSLGVVDIWGGTFAGDRKSVV